MKTTSISYKKIFPIAQYVNETIGIEMQVDDGDDPSHVFEEAKNRVEWWHTLIVTNPYVQNKVTDIPVIDKPHMDEIPVIQLGNKDSFLGAIIEAKTMEELASIKPILPKELLSDYMKKMRQLTPKTVNI